MCKKLKSFTEEIFKKLFKRICKLALSKIALLQIFNAIFIFRNSRYCSSYVAEFRDHTLQDDKIMGFLIQLCVLYNQNCREPP